LKKKIYISTLPFFNTVQKRDEMRRIKRFKWILFSTLPTLILGFSTPSISLLEKEISQSIVTTNADEVSIYHEYDSQGRLVNLFSTDNTIHYSLKYPSSTEVEIKDHIHDTSLKRIVDEKGRVITEIFPGDLFLHLTYDEKHLKKIEFKEAGSIHYNDHQNNLSTIKRISQDGTLLYQHIYHRDPYFFKEEFPTEPAYATTTAQGNTITINSPFGKQTYLLNEKRKIAAETIDQNTPSYNLSEKRISLTEADFFNHLQQGKWESDEELQCTYDRCGRLIKKQTHADTFLFYYDALNRLIKVETNDGVISFTYDLFNRRVSKTSRINNSHIEEKSIYLGNCELAIYNSSGEIKYLRVPGPSFHPSILKAIALESNSNTYVPIYNSCYQIDQLIDIETKEVIDCSSLDPFGANLHQFTLFSPWIFSTKHYDSETNLVYFGHRYYDPSLRRWLSPDPLRKKDDDPYLYNLNDPTHWIDPDGRFVIALPLIPLITGSAGTVLAEAAAGATLGTLIGLAMHKKKDIKQFDDACKEVGKKRGEKLSKEEKRLFHEEITGKGIKGYQELVNEGQELFNIY